MFASMKLFEAERYLVAGLKNVYEEPEAAAISNVLFEELTGYKKAERLMNKEQLLSSTQLDQLENHLRRLRDHEPVQYVLNKAWFHGMPLFVNRDVLIPRPETEELVEWVISDVKASGSEVFEKTYAEADLTKSLKVLDIGTGSGCLALALKKAMPLAEVWGCDISDKALNVARRNASELNIRVDFQCLDFLDTAQQKQLPTVNIAVSNPPYVPLRDKDTMHPNVLQYEPHTALFVPDDDALLFYRAIAAFGKHRLYPGGYMYMEIHEDLGKEVSALFENEGYQEVEIRRDMQGKERMVKVRSSAAAEALA